MDETLQLAKLESFREGFFEKCAQSGLTTDEMRGLIVKMGALEKEGFLQQLLGGLFGGGEGGGMDMSNPLLWMMLGGGGSGLAGNMMGMSPLQIILMMALGGFGGYTGARAYQGHKADQRQRDLLAKKTLEYDQDFWRRQGVADWKKEHPEIMDTEMAKRQREIDAAKLKAHQQWGRAGQSFVDKPIDTSISSRMGLSSRSLGGTTPTGSILDTGARLSLRPTSPPSPPSPFDTSKLTKLNPEDYRLKL
jgi:hypothetical protein